MFKFKKGKRETGLRAIGHPNPNTTIKFGTGKVGWIQAPSWSTEQVWRVWLHVKGSDGNHNCDFHNHQIAKKFETEPEAREWLKKNFAKLVKLGLHELEIQDE